MSAEALRWNGRRWSWLGLALILLVAALVRVPLLDVPFERDEGEYAYAGLLLLEGSPPYERIYNMKLPGIYAAYAAVMAVFGESVRGVHLGLLFTNALSTVLVFLLGRRLLDEAGALAAAAVFAVASLGIGVQGLWANAEHFVLPPVLAGFLVLHGARTKRRVFLGGALLGLGFLVKQHAALFGPAALLWVWASVATWPERLRLGGLLVAGAIVPYLVTCALMAVAGVFDTFWLWTFRYAGAYTQRVPLGQAGEVFANSFGAVTRGAQGLWILAAAGLLALTHPALRGRRLALGVFTAGSLLAICPGFLFRPHYFALLLPAVGLAAGAALLAAARHLPTGWKGRALLAALVLAPTGHALVAQRADLFGSTPEELVARVYTGNPFRESLEVGRFLRERSQEGDEIAMLGSEPQIPFYAGRRSATGFVYTYALMEDEQPFDDAMQAQMIRELESSRPRFLVFAKNPLSWLWGPEDQTDAIFGWLNEAFTNDYRLIGAVDLFPVPDGKGGGTFRAVYSFDAAALARRTVSPQNSLEIFERKR